MCSEGTFCVGGNSIEAKCPINTYNPDIGQVSCQPCPQGYICEKEGTIIPDNCPKGFYCEAGKEKKKCPAGTYSDKTNLVKALDCQ